MFILMIFALCIIYRFVICLCFLFSRKINLRFTSEILLFPSNFTYGNSQAVRGILQRILKHEGTLRYGKEIGNIELIHD